MIIRLGKSKAFAVGLLSVVLFGPPQAAASDSDLTPHEQQPGEHWDHIDQAEYKIPGSIRRILDATGSVAYYQSRKTSGIVAEFAPPQHTDAPSTSTPYLSNRELAVLTLKVTAAMGSQADMFDRVTQKRAPLAIQRAAEKIPGASPQMIIDFNWGLKMTAPVLPPTKHNTGARSFRDRLRQSELTLGTLEAGAQALHTLQEVLNQASNEEKTGRGTGLACADLMLISAKTPDVLAEFLPTQRGMGSDVKNAIERAIGGEFRYFGTQGRATVGLLRRYYAFAESGELLASGLKKYSDWSGQRLRITYLSPSVQHGMLNRSALTWKAWRAHRRARRNGCRLPKETRAGEGGI